MVHLLPDKHVLIYEEGSPKSQQYMTDIGRIDILAKDKKTNSYVVIELKKNQTSDDTVGQAMRYMGWIEEKYNFFIAAFAFVSDIHNFSSLEGQFTDIYYKTKFKSTLSH